jgi:hypothetical protein
MALNNAINPDNEERSAFDKKQIVSETFCGSFGLSGRSFSRFTDQTLKQHPRRKEKAHDRRF